ncbi:YsnF/AvaK domain-containing protein [Deinococcus altitudinis]|uniref:YsnF/AvaK domain-containing protein n=1 Tax=Deinococcus altitudinis TaxID=468914 RepID=UPI003891C0C0
MDDQKLQAAPPTTDVTRIGILELREEVPLLTKVKVQTGQVSFQREVRTRTETVILELQCETLVIEVRSGEGTVFIGDEPLQPGETREVLLYDERAVVTKQPYVMEEVLIGKRTVTETHHESIDLQYETLVTEQSVLDTTAQRPS